MNIALAFNSPDEQRSISKVLASDGQHRILWSSPTVGEVLVKYQAEPPDVLLLSVNFPCLNLSHLVKKLAALHDSTILIMTQAGDFTATIFATLGAGAKDVCTLPATEDAAAVFLRKLRMLARLAGHHIPRSVSSVNKPPDSSCLVAIGASTGGPNAVTDVLKLLPPAFPAAIVVVQHLDERFASCMANWMNSQVPLTVRTAIAGDTPTPGTVLLATGNLHWLVDGRGKLRCSRKPNDYPYRPSVDVFFSSLVADWHSQAIGVLLSGMGKDGAQGLKLMRSHGWHTLAQDEKSSAVFGMPKEAARIGAACEMLPPDGIGGRLVALVHRLTSYAGGQYVI